MKKYLKFIVIAALIIAALLAYNQVKKHRSRPEWRTDNPSSGTIREVVTATGSLNPYVLVEVGTEVSGKIEKLHKDFNDKVRKGELLAKLDTEILSANLESARAEVNKATISRDQAKLEYDISKDLYDRDMTAEYDMRKADYAYKQAQQNLANAQLNLQRAQKNLQNAYITSPIDGVVVARSVDEGQTVAASMSSPTLFKIANNLDQMQITANVDEADIGKIREKLPVEFTVDAYAGERFSGSVQQIRLNPITEQNVVSYSVIIDAANPEHKLLPGMTTNVTIIIQAKENALRIPEMATRFTPNKELWKLFGLKWEDDLIASARKKAIETAMASQNPPSGNPGEKAQAQTPPGKTGAPKDSAAVRAPGQRSMGQRGMAANSGNGRMGSSMIWVLKGKTPELIMVRTGVSDGAYIEVLSELDPDTVIITGVEYKEASQVTGNRAIQSGPGMRF
ncbi:MAG: efflux RND transporter periplasmic adaptor subunit [Candidatus Syntrophosphaera sp.]|nr:efflux RND transporter periplasmic adaptor subunit [Candidatus Syntrophosphaera sp.]